MSNIRKRAKHHLEHGTAINESNIIRDLLAECERMENRIAALETAITKTLNENGHLADGDNCSLIDLKRTMPNWDKEGE